MIITISHLRNAGMCARVARVWGARNGFDWQEFLDHGIPEEDLLATGDALAVRVVEMAHEAEDGE